MKNKAVLTCLAFTLLLPSCDTQDLAFENLKTIEIKEYRLLAPENFNLTEGQGYDSYVGVIEGSRISLTFDYGWYTSPERNVPTTDYIVITDTIDGFARQIVIANNSQRDNTSLHISHIDENIVLNYPNPLKIWTSNLTGNQQELVVKIFKSVTAER